MMKKILLFIFCLYSLLSYGEEPSAKIIKTEGEVYLYRYNNRLDISVNMEIYETDVIDAYNGAVLLFFKENEYSVIYHKYVKAGESTPVSLTKMELDAILKGEVKLSQWISSKLVMDSDILLERTKNINLILILDVSSSMEEVFPEVIKYIHYTLMDQILIERDFLYLFTFGTYTNDIYKKVLADVGRPDLIDMIYSLEPEDYYTDIGLALEVLDYALKGSFPYPKTVIFFITDGINNPSPESQYYGRDIYQEGAFDAYSIVKSGDYKVMLLSIGAITAARDLSGPLGGEYIEVSRDMSAEDLNQLISDFLNYIEMIVPSDLGNIGDKHINLKVAFLSNYNSEKRILITKAEYQIDDNSPVEIEGFNDPFNIMANEQIMTVFPIKLKENIQEGNHTLKIMLETQNNIVTKSIQTISFNYAPIPWLWIILIIIFALILFLVVLFVLHRMGIIDIPLFDIF